MSEQDYPAHIHVWKPVPMTDEEYEAHPYAKLLGTDKARCPDCNAPTHGGICLNACHLSAGQYQRFHAGLRAAGLGPIKSGDDTE